MKNRSGFFRSDLPFFMFSRELSITAEQGCPDLPLLHCISVLEHHQLCRVITKCSWSRIFASYFGVSRWFRVQVEQVPIYLQRSKKIDWHLVLPSLSTDFAQTESSIWGTGLLRIFRSETKAGKFCPYLDWNGFNSCATVSSIVHRIHPYQDEPQVLCSAT